MKDQKPDESNRPPRDQRGEKNNRKRNDRDGRGYDDRISAKEAEQMGLNFRSGPPAFKNDKKKDLRQVIDNSQKDLREIIDEEKDKEHGDGGQKPGYKIRNRDGNRGDRGGGRGGHDEGGFKKPQRGGGQNREYQPRDNQQRDYYMPQDQYQKKNRDSQDQDSTHYRPRNQQNRQGGDG